MKKAEFIDSVEKIKELEEAGVNSFKIEGRMKSEYYVATVTKAYRDAIDRYFDGLTFDEKIADEPSLSDYLENVALVSDLDNAQPDAKVVTLMTTNGQSPFVTLFLNLQENDPYVEENAMIIEEILKQREQPYLFHLELSILILLLSSKYP